MGVNGNKTGESRLVWRVSDENPTGELLELVPKEAPSRGRRASCKVVWTRVPPPPPDGPLGAKRFEPPAAEQALKAPVARTPPPSTDFAVGWRVSSWDLLKGLTVRDLSDKIPARTFDALFSANEASVRPPARKRR